VEVSVASLFEKGKNVTKNLIERGRG